MTTMFRIVAFAVTVTLAAVALVHVVGVHPAGLTPFLFALTAGAWVSVVVLAHFAHAGPRIGALTERAFVGLTIAVLGSVASVLALNTDLGSPWFTADVRSLIFRLSILAVLAVPCVWLVLWLAGRLGEDES